MSIGRFIATVFCCAAVFLSAIQSKGHSQSCLDYEPASVELSGRISLEEADGPPNYGEEPATDSKEWFLLLTLDAPICVNPDLDDLVNSDGEAGLSSLHMAYESDYPFRQEWLGPRVIVTGRLFHASTSHHQAPVLIEVSETRTADEE